MLARRKASGVAALLALVLLVTACSGAGSKPAAPGDNEGAPGKSKITIALASTVLTVGYPFLTTPQALGYWEAEGLEVEVVTTQGSQQVLQLMSSGQADLGVVNPEPVILARQQQSVPVKSVATISEIASWAIAMGEGSAIKSLKELKGKNIGVFSMASGGLPYLKARLKDEGLDPEKDVNVLPVGFGATAGEALKSGQIDALVLWTTAYAGLKNAGYKLTFMAPAPWEENLYSFNVVALEPVIKENPEMIQRALRGIAKSSEFGYARPEAVVQAFWNQYPDKVDTKLAKDIAFKNDLEIVKGQFRDMGFYVESLPKPPARLWGEQTVEKWTALQEYLVKTAQITKTSDAKEYFTDEFTKAANEFDKAAVVKQAQEFKVDVEVK